MEGKFDRVEIADGLTRKRFALIITEKFERNVRPSGIRVVGTFNEIEAAKKEANDRFAEFNPGMAIIVDTDSGTLLEADNWMHDSLLWKVVT